MTNKDTGVAIASRNIISDKIHTSSLRLRLRSLDVSFKVRSVLFKNTQNYFL